MTSSFSFKKLPPGSASPQGQERLLRIIACRKEGVTDRLIAEREGITEAHVKKLCFQAQRVGLDVPPAATDQEASLSRLKLRESLQAERLSQVATETSEPQAANADTLRHPSSFWAWISRRAVQSYGPEAVAQAVGVPTSALTNWQTGYQVPSAKHQDLLWQVLCAAVMHDTGMDPYGLEDLHEKLVAATKNRKV